MQDKIDAQSDSTGLLEDFVGILKVIIDRLAAIDDKLLTFAKQDKEEVNVLRELFKVQDQIGYVLDKQMEAFQNIILVLNKLVHKPRQE